MYMISNYETLSVRARKGFSFARQNAKLRATDGILQYKEDAPMRMIDLIIKKRNGKTLSQEEI